MGNGRRHLGTIALVAAVVAPVAAATGVAVGLGGEPHRSIERRPPEPSLSLTVSRPQRAASAVTVESTRQVLRVSGFDLAVESEPVDEAIDQTDEALAELESPSPPVEHRTDLSAAAAELRDGLARARADADEAAAAAADLPPVGELRNRYREAVTAFEDAVATALAALDDADASAAATLSWHAASRDRAVAELELALVGAGPDPVELTVPPGLDDLDLPAYPEPPPEPTDPALTDPALTDPGLLDPGLADPELPPAPDLDEPDLPPAPEEIEPVPVPDTTVPPPPAAGAAVPTSLTTPAASAIPAVTGATSAPGDAGQVPPEPTVSVAPPGLADMVARLRSAEAELAGAAASYDELVAPHLDDTAPLLEIADALLAGQPVPWSDVMEPPRADVPGSDALWIEIVDRYDDGRAVPAPVVRTERDRSLGRGVVVGTITFVVLVTVVAAVAVALSRRRQPASAPAWPPYPAPPIWEAPVDGPPAERAPAAPGDSGPGGGAGPPPPAPPWHEGPWRPPG